MGLMLARLDLNPPFKPAHMLLTVCFRFASWTGQFSVVPCAMSIVFDATVHCVNVMSERDAALHLLQQTLDPDKSGQILRYG